MTGMEVNKFKNKKIYHKPQNHSDTQICMGSKMTFIINNNNNNKNININSKTNK